MFSNSAESAKSPHRPHRWRFHRLGGFDQVRLETGRDLMALDQLDQKLWAALGCPTHGLEIDTKTLELIDVDGDKRIRAPDVIAAVQWAGAVLRDPDDLTRRASSLPLEAIDEGTEEGRQLLASAKRILVNCGKGGATVITPEDTADTERSLNETKFNGDGIIPVASADDEATKALIEAIMECVGSEQDGCGDPGVSQEKVDEFFAQARAYSDWRQKAENDSNNILPFGDATAAAAAAFMAVKSKVDDYFTRCRLAQFDPQAAEPLNPRGAQYEALLSTELSATTEEIAALPLAHIAPGRALPLEEGVNPAWAARVEKLRTEIVQPMFGDTVSVDAERWMSLSSKFAAHEDWLNEKEGALVEALGLERVREILAGGGEAVIAALIEKDKALAPEASAIASLDKLIRYHRDLFTLVNNFVSFHDFYTPETNAIFQAGILYLDGRSCELCVRVDDVEKHARLAALSRTYLTYCNCVRTDGAEQRINIAVAFTNGDGINLRVGRNGVFYDRQGQDWHATIVKVIENPISVREAFWAPYRRLGRMVAAQVERFAAAREKAVQAEAEKSIGGVLKEAEPQFDVAKFAGIFAAIGLALAAIGTAIVSTVTGFLQLTWWQMPLAVIVLFFAIPGPSMAAAYLSLRKRNLAPILDANGWAVNARAVINSSFGASLTSIAKLPEGSEHSLNDPFAVKRKRWKLLVALLVLLLAAGALWRTGTLDVWWDRMSTGETATEVEEPTQTKD
ncbi:MAG: hypothetical protein E2O65_00825 [Gammaproteobacteria bacterium]|nr:MAG: hypothetical protein E2O65_00825 [Gammaproteobacteria bacterium]